MIAFSFSLFYPFFFFFLLITTSISAEVEKGSSVSSHIPHSTCKDDAYDVTSFQDSLVAHNAALSIEKDVTNSHPFEDASEEGGNLSGGDLVSEENPELTSINNLFKWLKNNGAEIMASESLVEAQVLRGSEEEEEKRLDTEIERKTTRAEIGLVAARDIEMGETILTAPKKFWAGYETSKQGKNVSWEIQLSKWILKEKMKKNESFWYPFMQLLPEYVPSSYYYDDFLLDQLQDNHFVEEMKGELERLQTNYMKMEGEEEEEGEGGKEGSLFHASFEEFKWASTIVYSRCFSVDKLATFIPLGDLFNHDDDPNCNWNVSADNFTYYARAFIPKGAPITISYNSKNDRHFLSSYGFVPSGNYANTVEIFSTIDEIVEYFSLHVQRHDLLHTQHEWNMIVANNAKIYMDELLENSTSKFVDTFGNHVVDLGHFHLSALPNSQVDPRLIAVFGALWYFHTEGVEIDYTLLANNSFIYGRNIEERNCNELSETIKSSIAYGVDIIHMRVESLLTNFSTTLEADKSTLQILSNCKNNKYTGSEMIGKCKPHVLAYKNEIMNAIRYRMARKQILLDLKRRLEETCEIEHSW